MVSDRTVRKPDQRRGRDRTVRKCRPTKLQTQQKEQEQAQERDASPEVQFDQSDDVPVDSEQPDQHSEVTGVDTPKLSDNTPASIMPVAGRPRPSAADLDTVQAEFQARADELRRKREACDKAFASPGLESCEAAAKRAQDRDAETVFQILGKNSLTAALVLDVVHKVCFSSENVVGDNASESIEGAVDGEGKDSSTIAASPPPKTAEVENLETPGPAQTPRWRYNPQPWLRNEIRSLLIGAPVQLHTQLRVKDHGLADTVDATGAPKWVVAEMLSRMLDNSHTTAFLQKIGLLSEIQKETAEFSKPVLLDLWIERIISRVPYVPIPDFTDFREASTEEQEGIICLMHEFHMYLIHVAKIDVSATTHHVKHFLQMFAWDHRAPVEMTRPAFVEAVRHSWSDVAGNHGKSASLKHFIDFWKQRGRNCDIVDKAVGASETPIPTYSMPTPVPRPFKQGDGSKEARDAGGMCLPEGWEVHRRPSGAIHCYSSPGRRCYRSGPNVCMRLGRAPPASNQTITPKKFSKRPRPEESEESKKEAAPPAEPEELLPFEELVSAPTEIEAATKDDQALLPRVIATFTRYLEESVTPDQTSRQTTRDNYAMQIYKLFWKAGRNFDAMIEKHFVDCVCKSVENRKAHNVCGCALRKFQAFWRSRGGYDSVDTLDPAARDMKNMTVRPALEDAAGQCGAGGEAGALCVRPKQRCRTCNTVLRCSKHSGGHSVEECREIFWATHTKEGKRAKTVKDFFKKPGESASDAVPTGPIEIAC